MRYQKKPVIHVVLSLCAFVGFVFTVSRSCSAQSSEATLGGVVEDSSGANLPAVAVSVTSVETGVTRNATTNGSGLFSVPGLNPGRYSVHVEHPGFSPVEVGDITLNVGTIRQLEIKLPLGNTEQSITVDGSGATINTTDASVSTVVDRQFVENLPLNGRSFQSLITLTPGVVTTPTSDGAEGGQFSVAGQRAGSNYFTIDGVSANFAAANGIFESETTNGGLPAFSALGSTASLVSVDALQEFRFETSTYAPEYGRENGGQAALVTRSGTNQFHGTVFDYFRNDALDAYDWFAENEGLPKPREHQNDFGGVFGGPIVKNKTFFFFSYEGLRVLQPVVSALDVPSIAARENAVPSVKPILNAFALPNGPATGDDLSQFAASYANPSNLDATSLRLDHTLNLKTTLFARFNYSPSARVVGGFATNTLSRTTQTIETATVGVTAAISPTITNDLRLNYSRARGTERWNLDDFGGATVLPPSGIFSPLQNPAVSWAFVAFANGRSISLLEGDGADNVTRQSNLADSIEVTKGTHSIKFGLDLRRLTPVEGHPQTGLFPEWLNLSELVRGESPDVLIYYQDPSNIDLRFHNFSLYAQDTWRASRRLTLNYGVRWDYNPPPVVTSGNAPYVLSETTDLATASLLPRGTALWQADWKNFAPRVGISYVLTPNASHTTVLRAGFGQFYDLGTSSAGSLDDGQGFYPYSLVTTLCSFGSGTQCNTSAPYSGPYSGPLPPFAFSQPYAGVMRAFDTHLKVPYSLQWNVAIERSLSANQTFKITYVGSNGKNLLRDDVIANPNPILSGLFLSTNSGYSNYNALQAQFQRRLSQGLQALVSYTWSHSLDLNSADVSSPWGGASVGVPTNLYNIRQDYGNSDFDIQQTFSAAMTYDISAQHIHSAFERFLLRDWSLDSNNSVRSGTPFNVTYQPATAGAFTGPTGPFDLRPDQVPNQPVYVSNRNIPGGKQLNFEAFAIPSSLRQGSEGRNSIRGFPLLEMDLAIRRQFYVGEHLKMLFRAEAFNVINHPNFGNPANNLGTCALGVPCTQSNYGWGTSQAMLNQSLGSGGSTYDTPFGSLYQIGGPRSLQMSMKLQF